MRFGSLFAGVGGFDLALSRSGMTPAWSVELDAQCRAVLRRHWPEVPHYEDVHDVGPGLTPVDLICGGFPCQDYSVAGKRGGLAGDRGALWWEMHRIIAECRPTWVVGENVPGLLSSGGGRDFRTIVRSLVDLGYGVTWAVLDSQHFGVAQRRRRLFIVGHSGGVPRPEILALSEGLFGHPAPSREAGEGVAGCIGGGSAESGKRGWRNDLDTQGAYPLLEVGGRTNGDGYRDGDGIGNHGDPMYSLQARHQHGVAQSLAIRGRDGTPPAELGTDGLANAILTPSGGRAGIGCGAVLAHTLRAEGFDASEDETGRGTPIVCFDTTQVTSKANRSNPQPGDPCHPLAAGAHAPLMAFQQNQREEVRELGDVAGAIAGQAGMHNQNFITTAVARRLTPTECERLQGFPDGHTEWGIREDGTRWAMADGPRYRIMGNAVTVNVAEWIARRLRAAREG